MLFLVAEQPDPQDLAPGVALSQCGSGGPYSPFLALLLACLWLPSISTTTSASLSYCINHAPIAALPLVQHVVLLPVRRLSDPVLLRNTFLLAKEVNNCVSVLSTCTPNMLL